MVMVHMSLYVFFDSTACSLHLLFNLGQGIIAAVPGNEYNISGVAYGATLAAYKVFDCAGHTTDDSKQ